MSFLKQKYISYKNRHYTKLQTNDGRNWRKWFEIDNSYGQTIYS